MPSFHVKVCLPNNKEFQLSQVLELLQRIYDLLEVGEVKVKLTENKQLIFECI